MPPGAHHEAIPDLPQHQPDFCRPRCWSRRSNAQLPYTTPRWQCRRQGLPELSAETIGAACPDPRPNATALLLSGTNPPACNGGCCQRLSPQLGAPACPCTAAASGDRDPAPRSAVPPGMGATGAQSGSRSPRRAGQATRHAGAREACSWHRAPAASHQHRRGLAPWHRSTRSCRPGSSQGAAQLLACLREVTRAGRGRALLPSAPACPPRFRKAPAAVERKRVKNPGVSAEPPQTQRPSRHQAWPGGATTAVWTSDTTRGHQRSGTNQAAG